MQAHQYANAFPMMTDKEYSDLIESMKSDGYHQHEPIMLYKGQILDGRNRHKAAQELNIMPMFVKFDGDDEAAYKYARSTNLARKHWSLDQLAVIGLDLEPIEKEFAAQRMKAGKKIDPVANLPQGKTRDIIAAAVGVSVGKMRQAQSVAKAAPDLIAKVKAGTMPLKEAEKQVKAQERQTARAEIVQFEKSAVESGKAQSVQSGDWWKLGDHLLYCGDTSHEDFISKLPKAKLAFSDPPYGAEVAEWDNKFYWKHDYLIDNSEVVIVTPGIMSIFEFARITKMPYVWSMSFWISNGMTRGAMGFGNWIYAAIFSSGSVFRNKQDFYKISITGEYEKHKGQKPIEAISEIVSIFTERGETVIDPFLGSGTTLLACEKMERACIGGEINPEYCGKIISRWEKATGKKATK